MKSKPNIVDLCCGAGGLSEGFKQAGFEIAMGVDIDSNATQTFSYNHKESHTETVDLNFLKPRKFKKMLKLLNKDIDVIVAGLPCRPFSCANRKGGINFNSYVSLVEKFSSLIEKTKPSWFVIENVLPF